MLVVVCGLPGTGKSTVAERIADRLDGRRVRTDVVRKDLFESPAYTEAETEAVYDAALDRAGAALAADDAAVLDGTFRAETHREAAAGLADRRDEPTRFVRVECDPGVVRERIATRADDPSDADFAVYRQLRDSFDPLSRPHVTVDNSGSLAETVAQVEEHF